jgi:hypothetical protein
MITYKEWTALSEEQQLEEMRGWHSYQGEGASIVEAAGLHLMEKNPDVIATSFALFHGGEGIIHAYVTRKELETTDPFNTEIFSGFRVYYLCGDLPPKGRAHFREEL